MKNRPSSIDDLVTFLGQEINSLRGGGLVLSLQLLPVAHRSITQVATGLSWYPFHCTIARGKFNVFSPLRQSEYKTRRGAECLEFISLGKHILCKAGDTKCSRTLGSVSALYCWRLCDAHLFLLLTAEPLVPFVAAIMAKHPL